MLEIKTYKGYYTFNKKEHNLMRGHINTIFYIDIKEIQENKFIGNTEEDKNTGGIEGKGLIEGTINNDKVFFTKKMPYLTILTSINTTKTFKNKKHTEILYQGTIDMENRLIYGTWKTKLNIIWFGIIPIPFFPSKGSWKLDL